MLKKHSIEKLKCVKIAKKLKKFQLIKCVFKMTFKVVAKSTFYFLGNMHAFLCLFFFFFLKNK